MNRLAHVAQMVERVLGKDEVTSSILVVGSSVGNRMVVRRSPEAMHRSNPDGGPDAKILGGSNSVARVTAFQAVGRGFESRLPLLLAGDYTN